MNALILASGALLLGGSSLLAQTPALAPTTATVAAATPAPSAAPSVSSDEQQLLGIEQEWCNACLHGDADYLSRLLTEDFVFTGDRAETTGKAVELQETRDRTVRYTVFENHEMTVHLYGDAAVVTGRTRLKGTVAASGKLIEAESRFTHVFARVEGRWRAVAAHVSPGSG